MYRIKNKSVILITTAYSRIPNVFPKKNKNKKKHKKKNIYFIGSLIKKKQYKTLFDQVLSSFEPFDNQNSLTTQQNVVVIYRFCYYYILLFI